MTSKDGNIWSPTSTLRHVYWNPDYFICFLNWFYVIHVAGILGVMAHSRTEAPPSCKKDEMVPLQRRSARGLLVEIYIWQPMPPLDVPLLIRCKVVSLWRPNRGNNKLTPLHFHLHIHHPFAFATCLSTTPTVASNHLSFAPTLPGVTLSPPTTTVRPQTTTHAAAETNWAPVMRHAAHMLCKVDTLSQIHLQSETVENTCIRHTVNLGSMKWESGTLNIDYSLWGVRR